MAGSSIFGTPDGILDGKDQLFAETAWLLHWAGITLWPPVAAKHDLQQYLGRWYVAKVLPKATQSRLAFLPQCQVSPRSVMHLDIDVVSMKTWFIRLWCADAHVPIVAPIMVDMVELWSPVCNKLQCTVYSVRTNRNFSKQQSVGSDHTGQPS